MLRAARTKKKEEYLTSYSVSIIESKDVSTIDS